MRYLLLVLFLPLLTACSVTPERLDPRHFSAAPLQFNFPVVVRDQLPNGMQLYQLPDHELPLVELSVMIGSGSISDPASKTGLGDLFATTLRTGGAGDRSPDSFDALLEQHAINLGVSSGTYASLISLSLRSEDLPLGIELLADLLRRPRFAAERLEIARNQAMEAVRRRNDNPGSVAHRAISEALYPGHPFGRSASRGSLERIERIDLLDFAREALHPDNLRLGISGDFSPETLRQLLEQHFGDWAAAGVPAQVVPPLPDPPPAAAWVSDRELPQTTILMAESGIEKSNPDLYAVKVMNYLLGGGGFNSRLMREIRSNRGLAYSVYSYFQVGRRLPGAFIAGCETKNSSVGEVLTLMRQEMHKLKQQPVGETELRRAKESLINSFVFAFEDRHDVVDRQMRIDFFNYPADYLDAYRRRIAAVTVADVQRVAKLYLHPDRQLLVLVGRQADFAPALEQLNLSIEPITEE